MAEKRGQEKRAQVAADRRPEFLDYWIFHEHATSLAPEFRKAWRKRLEAEIAVDPARARELGHSLKLAKAFEAASGKPWMDSAGALTDRIHRGAWDEIDADSFVRLLKELSEAVRSRYDEPARAASEALDQIFDALKRTGPGRRRGVRGLMFDLVHRPGREVLLAEWLLYLEAKKAEKKETTRRRRAGDDFDRAKFLIEHLGADRLASIELHIGRDELKRVKTKREAKAALGLSTRTRPSRRPSRRARKSRRQIF